MSDPTKPVFGKILIANRGEIACRIMRTANRLGIATVAIHSTADANALHVRMADEAYCVGEPQASLSYLNIDAILGSAEHCGAQAIHPGYGFLSENAGFSQAVIARGLAFIGPPADAIRLMGDKNTALRLVRDAGVNTLPNNLGGEQSDSALRISAETMGFPVMVKPSAGGGGKGMHIVTDAKELESVLQTSRREAQTSFGNQELLIERYLEHARHIEVQVFADTHGNVVHLYERDCSVQRRHQKVIEESPATGLSKSLLEQLQHQALLATRSIDYVGAGTIEFLVAGDEFYFLEMNTRLQVEHPVTEILTGVDLVEWQLRVAAGEAIPIEQSEISRAGHAIEVRIYAEDPDAGFLPASGKITRLELPTEEKNVRVDSGLQLNDEVSVYYDPLLMKLIAGGANRADAIARLDQALRCTNVEGVKTNLRYLSRVLRQPDYVAGRFDTGFLDTHTETLTVSDQPASEHTLALACLYILLVRESDAQSDNWAAADARVYSPDPHSPWHRLVSWRLNHHALEKLIIRNAGVERPVSVLHLQAQHYVLDTDLEIGGKLTERNTRLSAEIGKELIDVSISTLPQGFIVDTGTELQAFAEVRVDDTHTDGADQQGHLRSPMPGTIVSVNVGVGDKVVRGQALLVLEAMKMEHTITAPADGVVAEMIYKTGDRVDADVELLVIDTSSPT